MNGTGSDLAQQPRYYTQIYADFFRDPSISPSAKALGGLLCTYTNGGNVAWPGNKRLGEQMGWSARQVRRVLSKLESKAYLTRYYSQDRNQRNIIIEVKVQTNGHVGHICPTGGTQMSSELESSTKNQVQVHSNPMGFLESFTSDSNPSGNGNGNSHNTGPPLTIDDLSADLEQRIGDLEDDDATRYYGEEGSSAADDWYYRHHGTSSDAGVACDRLGTVERIEITLWDAETNENESPLRRFRAICQDPARWWPGVMRRWRKRNGKAIVT